MVKELKFFSPRMRLTPLTASNHGPLHEDYKSYIVQDPNPPGALTRFFLLASYSELFSDIPHRIFGAIDPKLPLVF